MKIGAGFNPEHYKEDACYREFLNKNFDSLSSHWGLTRFPKIVKPAVALAKLSGKEVFGHYLFSREEVPNWLNHQNHDHLLDIYLNTISELYGNCINTWLVANEMFYPYGIVNCHWKQILGHDKLIDRLFTKTQEYFPESELWLSEFAIGQNPKLWGYLYTEVRRMLDKGVPIHGISAHLHTDLYYQPKGFEISGKPAHLFPYHAIKGRRLQHEIRRFKKLGLKFHLSELTVWPKLNEQSRIEAQGRVYKRYVKIALEESCDRISFWSPLDDPERTGISWHWQNKVDYPGLWFKEDGEIKPKPFTEDLLRMIR